MAPAEICLRVIVYNIFIFIINRRWRRMYRRGEMEEEGEKEAEEEDEDEEEEEEE